jgi:hypothetical protein
VQSEEEPDPSVPGGNVRALHSGKLREDSESRPAVLRILVVVCGCASDQPQSYGNGCGGLYELSELDKAGNEDVVSECESLLVSASCAPQQLSITVGRVKGWHSCVTAWAVSSGCRPRSILSGAQRCNRFHKQYAI